MKKMVILHIPNAKNNGSAMMAINIIDLFNRNFKNRVEFFCDFATDEDKRRIISESRKEISICTLAIPKFDRGSNLLSSFFNRLRWIKEVVDIIGKQQPLAVVVLGGDDFSEYYSGYKIVILFFLMYRITRKLPVYLIGHTIGPFYHWRKPAFRFLMYRCRIVTRDQYSLKYCKKEIKHKHCDQGHDLAWFDLPNQSAKRKNIILTKYGLQEDAFIVIVPSALVYHYANSADAYFTSWRHLLEKLSQKGYRIVLMPHVFSHTKKDDRWTIQEIMNFPNKLKGIIQIHDMLLPSECRAILSAAHFSITCRMHSAVSTLQTGKPTIALSYSAKYAGVIGADMGLPELIIEASNKILWGTEITDLIMEKVKFIEKNYKSIVSRIVSRVEIIKQEQFSKMEEYSRQIWERNGVPFEK